MSISCILQRKNYIYLSLPVEVMINCSDNTRPKIWHMHLWRMSREGWTDLLLFLVWITWWWPHLRKSNQNHEKSSGNWTTKVISKKRSVDLFWRQCRSHDKQWRWGKFFVITSLTAKECADLGPEFHPMQIALCDSSVHFKDIFTKTSLFA